MYLLLTVALGAPVAVHSIVDTGSLKSRLSKEPADLVLLYGGEQAGSQSTCGCPTHPRGSLGRIEAYAEAVRRSGVPTLLLNAGNWLDDPVGADNALRADARVANRHMLAAVDAGTWTALNASFRDLPMLGEVATLPTGVVSANGQGIEGLAPYRVVQAGDYKVAITGVTVWSKKYLQPDGVEFAEAIESIHTLLPTLRAEADLVVVMTYGLGRANKDLSKLDIDVIVDAGDHHSSLPPVVVNDTIWVRSMFETQHLGELRLLIEDGKILLGTDRSISLDAKIRAKHPWRVRERESLEAVRQTQEALFGR